jgi:hypothetical protein
MEKLFIAVIVLFVCFTTNAQDSLCVFKINGSAFNKTKTSLKPITKGTFIHKKEALLLDEKSSITAINASGDAYKLEGVGEYKFQQILNNKIIPESRSLTSKYLKLIWKELTNSNTNKTIIGGVFRGDVLMRFPKDSSKVVSSKVSFKWQFNETDKLYYLIIRNTKTGELLKIEADGSTLSLYKSNPIFAEGNSFHWMVSTNEFPNLKNSPFYNFSLINREEYKALQLEYLDVIKDLKKMGLTEEEIENSLCETYRICK